MTELLILFIYSLCVFCSSFAFLRVEDIVDIVLGHIATESAETGNAFVRLVTLSAGILSWVCAYSAVIPGTTVVNATRGTIPGLTR